MAQNESRVLRNSKKAEASRLRLRLERIEAGEQGWQGCGWSLERLYPQRFARPEILNQIAVVNGGKSEFKKRKKPSPARVCAREARQLLSWNGAAARYLGRLKRCHPERVGRLSHEDARRWRIRPASTVTPVTPKK